MTESFTESISGFFTNSFATIKNTGTNYINNFVNTIKNKFSSSKSPAQENISETYDSPVNSTASDVKNATTDTKNALNNTGQEIAGISTTVYIYAGIFLDEMEKFYNTYGYIIFSIIFAILIANEMIIYSATIRIILFIITLIICLLSTTCITGLQIYYGCKYLFTLYVTHFVKKEDKAQYRQFLFPRVFGILPVLCVDSYGPRYESDDIFTKVLTFIGYHLFGYPKSEKDAIHLLNLMKQYVEALGSSFTYYDTLKMSNKDIFAPHNIAIATNIIKLVLPIDKNIISSANNSNNSNKTTDANKNKNKNTEIEQPLYAQLEEQLYTLLDVTKEEINIKIENNAIKPTIKPTIKPVSGDTKASGDAKAIMNAINTVQEVKEVKEVPLPPVIQSKQPFAAMPEVNAARLPPVIQAQTAQVVNAVNTAQAAQVVPLPPVIQPKSK